MALLVELSRRPARGGPHPPRALRAARWPRSGGCLLLVVRRDPGRRLRRAHDRRPSASPPPWRWSCPPGAWLLMPKDGTPEAAGAELDSSMVALVIAELPDHASSSSTPGSRRSTRWPTSGPRPPSCCARFRSARSPTGPHARRRMPPKSTYFHPKPRTGMVFRTLDSGRPAERDRPGPARVGTSRITPLRRGAGYPGTSRCHRSDGPEKGGCGPKADGSVDLRRRPGGGRLWLLGPGIVDRPSPSDQGAHPPPTRAAIRPPPPRRLPPPPDRPRPSPPRCRPPPFRPRGGPAPSPPCPPAAASPRSRASRTPSAWPPAEGRAGAAPSPPARGWPCRGTVPPGRTRSSTFPPRPQGR